MRGFERGPAIAAAGEHAVLQLLGFPQPVYEPEADDEDDETYDRGEKIDEDAPGMGVLLILLRVCRLDHGTT